MRFRCDRRVVEVARVTLLTLLLAWPTVAAAQQLAASAKVRVPVGQVPGAAQAGNIKKSTFEVAPVLEVMVLNEGLQFGSVIQGTQKVVQRVDPGVGKVLVRVERPNGGPRQRRQLYVFITFPTELTMGGGGGSVPFEGAAHASLNQDDAQNAEPALSWGRYAYFDYEVRTRQEAGSQFGEVYVYLHGLVDVGAQAPAGTYDNFVEVQAYYF